MEAHQRRARCRGVAQGDANGHAAAWPWRAAVQLPVTGRAGAVPRSGGDNAERLRCPVSDTCVGEGERQACSAVVQWSRPQWSDGVVEKGATCEEE